MKILVVEDNTIVAKMLGIMLGKTNCDFDVALSGTQAIELYLANCYDAIFMDIGLPDINGITASKIIRQNNTLKKYIPIIAITAHSDKVLKETAFKAGMDEFIPKPLDPQCIYDLISKLKDGYYNKNQIEDIVASS
jgi:CheY-like chemotaxis protein